MIEFYCQSCYEIVCTADETAGKKGRCPHCRAVMQIPIVSQTTNAETPVARRQTGDRSLASQPGVAAPQRSPAEDLFRALERPETWGKQARANRGTIDPKVDSLVSLKREESPQRRAAHAALRGPALGLMILSGLALIGVIAFFLVWGLMQSLTTGMNIRGKEVTFQVVPTIAAVGLLSFVQCIVLLGAAEMWKVGKYGLCVAAAIIAMLPCGLTTLLSTPFGVWALVVLMRADVRHAFR